MNWAILAPESRLFKGKNLFRWEVSPGLDARAKSSCLGKHVEPCHRFHQQLHFVGKSHECFGCNVSDEMHHNRHKDILKIVRQVRTVDEGNLPTSSTKTLVGATVGPKPRRGSITTNITSPTDTSSETFVVDGSRLSRRARKKAGKVGNGSVAKEKRNVEVFPKEDTNYISEAIHLTVLESKGAWVEAYVYDNKENGEEQSIMDDPEVEDIAEEIDQFSVKSPNSMTPRQRKTLRKFSPVSHSSFRGGSRKFSPKATSATDPYDGVDPKIFSRLDIEVFNPVKSSKARKDLIAKLVAAIKEDLEIMDREDKESRIREEGFWRWSGKTAYHEMRQTRENLDWATGQRIGRRINSFVEDDAENDGDVEEGIESSKPKFQPLSPILDLNEERFNEMTFGERLQLPKMKFQVQHAIESSKPKHLPLSPIVDENEKWFGEMTLAKRLQPPKMKFEVEHAKLTNNTPAVKGDEVEIDAGGWTVVKTKKGAAKRGARKVESPRFVHR